MPSKKQVSFPQESDGSLGPSEEQDLAIDQAPRSWYLKGVMGRLYFRSQRFWNQVISFVLHVLVAILQGVHLFTQFLSRGFFYGVYNKWSEP